MVLYTVGQIEIQVYLINQLIVKVSEKHNTNIIFNKRNNKRYQEEVYTTFCVCVSHHAMLKKYIKGFKMKAKFYLSIVFLCRIEHLTNLIKLFFVRQENIFLLAASGYLFAVSCVLKRITN